MDSYCSFNIELRYGVEVLLCVDSTYRAIDRIDIINNLSILLLVP
jgi:hypothetical protein